MKDSIRSKIEALAARNHRSTELVADFSGGFADGWYMAVKQCFRNQLDIKYTTRVEHITNASNMLMKSQVRIWTQGPRIAFETGHIFYDNPLAYGNWDHALRHIKLACFVVEATPNEIRKKKTDATKDEINELLNGQVVFDLFVPDQCKTKLKPRDRFTISQIKFVEFLMTGNLP